MTKGVWIVLSGLGGELDRTFVADKGSEGANRRAWKDALAELTVDPGDTITIEEGESETDAGDGFPYTTEQAERNFGC